MKITEYLKNNVVYLDGGMGTLLQARGLPIGELPERWNISHPEIVREIHGAYYDAGSNIVSTNTFGANSLKFSSDELDEIIGAAVAHARFAAKNSRGKQRKWVALDIGPTGKMLKPLGELDFEDAVSIFAETVRLGVKHGVDLFFIETMNDCLETKAALLAVKENSNLPVFVSNAYGEDGKLMTGASAAAMVAMLEGMGADAVGINCSFGPDTLSDVVDEYLKYSSVPVILKPNAGLPRLENGSVVYDLSAEKFAERMADFAARGVRILGGCCGTNNEYISALVKSTKGISVRDIEKKNHTLVSSYTHTMEFGNRPILIGERINPTGKPLLKSALLSGDMDYILKEAITQEERGAQILDVNVGLPGVKESELLSRAVREIQAVTDLPLQIDTSSIEAMESALRHYNGKALINSVNGKRESMEAVFPLVKKYGGAVIALTLDEGGIPEKAEDRLKIARKILAEAEKYGIDKKDIIFDPLAMSISADGGAAKETLRALKLIKEELGCHTSLGVSNVSYGLPKRDIINSIYFTMALEDGLSAAIMNPYSSEMMKAYHAYLALKGLDEKCFNYIDFATGISEVSEASVLPTAEAEQGSTELEKAVIKGLSAKAAELTRELIKTKEPLSVVNEEIIPALNKVGEGFERKTVYLPQLLMSAEAAKSAFAVIKEAMPRSEAGGKGRIILATVKGDIHDIGKNIVKLILENYGYEVTDLGKDVSPDFVLSEAIRLKADIVGLSALMTTTLPSMEETIGLLRKKMPKCKIMVGGAVLTPEYAKTIGVDAYAKDAMEALRCAERLMK